MLSLSSMVRVWWVRLGLFSGVVVRLLNSSVGNRMK